mmetsp:Transcript_15130/g.16831  ORF Transcript_15130/g.16831 Transcript_15130/m.16831 type:complete len:208 (+) Transcript_15130:9-632(+)
MAEANGASKWEYNVLPGNPPLQLLLLKKTLKYADRLTDVGIERFFHDTLDTFANKEFDLSRYEQFPPAQINRILEAYKLFFSRAIGLNLPLESIVEDLTAAGVSQDTIKLIATVISARKPEILKALSEDCSSISNAHLQDFDWKLHLCMATDKLSTMREPLLIIKLVVKDVNGKDNPILLELSTSELDDLVSKFDVINEELRKIQVN